MKKDSPVFVRDCPSAQGSIKTDCSADFAFAFVVGFADSVGFVGSADSADFADFGFGSGSAYSSLVSPSLSKIFFTEKTVDFCCTAFFGSAYLSMHKNI